MSFKFLGGFGWSLVCEFKNLYLFLVENLSRWCLSLWGWMEIERVIIIVILKFLLFIVCYFVENIEFVVVWKFVYFLYGIL